MVRPEKIEALRIRMEQLGIKESDLDEQFIRGSGHGGQKVNKTNNCVFLKHLPSGISVKCHIEREREINRFLARRELCDAYEASVSGESPAKTKTIMRMRRNKQRKHSRAKKRLLEKPSQEGNE